MRRFVILLISLLMFNFSYSLTLEDLVGKREDQLTGYSFNYDRTTNTATIRLYAHIETADKYDGLFNSILSLPNDANIILYTGGYGGKTDTFVSILSLLAPHRARVTVLVVSPAYSGHAFLACAGDKVIMFPGTLLMFHGLQYEVPVPEDVKKYQDKAIIGEILRTYCTHLVTQEEIKYIEDTGGDLYIRSAEVQRRVAQ